MHSGFFLLLLFFTLLFPCSFLLPCFPCPSAGPPWVTVPSGMPPAPPCSPSRCSHLVVPFFWPLPTFLKHALKATPAALSSPLPQSLPPSQSLSNLRPIQIFIATLDSYFQTKPLTGLSPELIRRVSEDAEGTLHSKYVDFNPHQRQILSPSLMFVVH